MTDAQLAILLRRIAWELNALLDQLEFKLPDSMFTIQKSWFIPDMELRVCPVLSDLHEFRAGLEHDAENLERPTA